MRRHESESLTGNKKPTNHKARKAVAGIALAAATITGIGCAPGKTEARTTPIKQKTGITQSSGAPETHQESPTTSSAESSHEKGIVMLDGPFKNPSYTVADKDGKFDIQAFVLNYVDSERAYQLTGDERYLLAMSGSLDTQLSRNEINDARPQELQQAGYPEGAKMPYSVWTIGVDTNTLTVDLSNDIVFTTDNSTKTPTGVVRKQYEMSISTKLIPNPENPSETVVVADDVSATLVSSNQ